ncbi:MAG: ferritin-like domain-containing protein [Polyangiaceae bacterium]
MLETTFDATPFKKPLPNAEAEANDNWELFDQFIDMCEGHRWKMSDVRAEIESVDPSKLTENDLKVIDCVGEVAVVEGNAPSIVVNQLAIMLLDAEFASWALYQAGEESKHFHVIRHYCRHVKHPISRQHGEASLVGLQKGYDPNDFIDQYGVILINILGETLNIHLYQALAGVTDEPVLKGLLQRIARDERRHLEWFVAYFRKRAAKDPAFVAAAQESLRSVLRLDEKAGQRAQQHQGTGAKNYVNAVAKVLKYGYASRVITRTVEEQWQQMKKCFGDALTIDKRQFFYWQMARPAEAMTG